MFTFCFRVRVFVKFREVLHISAVTARGWGTEFDHYHNRSPEGQVVKVVADVIMISSGF
jgi:hypothetical protein